MVANYLPRTTAPRQPWRDSSRELLRSASQSIGGCHCDGDPRRRDVLDRSRDRSGVADSAGRRLAHS
jgi:hypothetical protein